MSLLFIVYVIAAYIAYCRVNRHKVYFYTDTMKFYVTRIFTCIMFGWALIPLAIIMHIFGINK